MKTWRKLVNIIILAFIFIPVLYSLVFVIHRNIERYQIESYIRKKYGNNDDIFIDYKLYYEEYNDYEVEAFLRERGFKVPGYIYSMRSKSSEDIQFAIGLHKGEIHDSYDQDITLLNNTKLRMNDELNTYLYDFFHPYVIAVDTVYGRYDFVEDKVKKFMYLDMPYDKNLPFEVEIYIVTKLINLDEDNEILAKAIKE